MKELYKYCVLILFSISSTSFGQKKSYDGQGAVSVIIMASPAEMVGHFDMFFNSKVKADDADKQMYWYKIAFTKDCFFDFTLFPLVETDRYSFVAFKTDNALSFCEANVKQSITPINDMRITKKYTDNEQTESFRSNLVLTKKTPVKAGETVYLVIKNLWGKDLGHIIGLNTCDYSYVLEVEKTPPIGDSTKKQESVYSELKHEEALAAVGRKLCPPDSTPVKLGTVDFNKTIAVSNQMYINGKSKGGTSQKILPTDLILPKPVESVIAKKTATDTIVKSAPTAATKKADKSQHVKSNLPKPEIWLKSNPIARAEARLPETPKKNNAIETSLVPVRCLVSDVVKGVAVDNAPVIIDELTGKKIAVKKLNSGEYELAVEKTKSYKVECNALGYKNFDHSINIYKALNGEENLIELKLQPLVAGENFILKNIYFNPNTPVIKVQSNSELEKLFSFMKNNPDAVISIEGHTNSNRYISRDSRRQKIGGKWAFHGTAKKLSKYRANEVKDYLEKKGIDSSRIKTEGWGGDKELYPNARTLEESSKNMRVEVVLLKT